MMSNAMPMLSSTPPPFDDIDGDEGDDDFGDFAGVPVTADPKQIHFLNGPTVICDKTPQDVINDETFETYTTDDVDSKGSCATVDLSCSTLKAIKTHVHQDSGVYSMKSDDDMSSMGKNSDCSPCSAGEYQLNSVGVSDLNSDDPQSEQCAVSLESVPEQYTEYCLANDESTQHNTSPSQEVITSQHADIECNEVCLVYPGSDVTFIASDADATPTESDITHGLKSNAKCEDALDSEKCELDLSDGTVSLISSDVVQASDMKLDTKDAYSIAIEEQHSVLVGTSEETELNNVSSTNVGKLEQEIVDRTIENIEPDNEENNGSEITDTDDQQQQISDDISEGQPACLGNSDEGLADTISDLALSSHSGHHQQHSELRIDDFSHENSNDDDDDFGDFTDVPSTDISSKHKGVNSRLEDDDFCDLRDCSPYPKDSSSKESFGSFQGPTTGAEVFGEDAALKETGAADKFQFGDFSRQANSSSFAGDTLTKEFDVQAYGSYLQRLFPNDNESTAESSESTESFSSPSAEYLDDVLTVPEEEEEESPSQFVIFWKNIRDVDATNALQYAFDNSKCSKLLLHVLKIDTRNIFNRPGLPAFAVDLRSASVLVPTVSSERQSSPPEVSSEASTEMVPAQSSGSHTSSQSTGQSASQSPSKESTSPDSPVDIPPVEFDWKTAGLTNPLEGLDAELADLEKGAAPVQTVTRKPLEELLAAATTTTVVTPAAMSGVMTEDTTDGGMSEEARTVLDSLPDLSWIHAPCLMFPVGKSPVGKSPPE